MDIELLGIKIVKTIFGLGVAGMGIATMEGATETINYQSGKVNNITKPLQFFAGTALFLAGFGGVFVKVE